MTGGVNSRTGPLRVTLLDSIAEWGGGEKWCAQSALALARRGHFATIACVRGTPLERRAREAGVLTWTARGAPFGWRPGSALSLAGFLRRHRIEALIGNVGRDLRMGALACRLAGVKLLQRRGLLRPIKPTLLNRWLYRRHVRRIIVNARAIRERMLEGVDFVDPGRFVHIPNGIDTSRPPAGEGLRLRASLVIPEHSRLVAVVGRLSAMKGHEYLLEAWPAVRGALPDAQLLIAGDGPRRVALEARTVGLGIGESVRFLGFRRDLDDLYAATDLLVLPSLRDEGCNNALLEAMWHGCPAVVTECGGLSEIAEDEGTGRVVPVGDARALSEAISGLLRDVDARNRMGSAAQKIVEARYSLEFVTDLLERFLIELRAESAP